MKINELYSVGEKVLDTEFNRVGTIIIVTARTIQIKNTVSNIRVSYKQEQSMSALLARFKKIS